MKKYLGIIILLTIVLSSCRKDIDDYDVKVIEPEVTVLIESTIKGKIIDEDGNPVENANVQVGDYSTITDAKGQYKFEKIRLKKNQSVISAEKDGYFIGSSTTKLSANAVSYPQLTMIEKGEPVQIDASKGGEIALDGGAKITLPKNAIKRANGSTYKGKVNMFSKTISPNAKNFVAALPGKLEGITSEGLVQSLAPFGMLKLEIETEDGEKLQLDDDAGAEVEIPVEDELLARAPEEVPLWVFDLDLGRWVQTDICHKTHGGYSGPAGPGTIIPCEHYDFVNFETNIFHNDTTPASYLILDLEAQEVTFKERWYSDSEGHFETTIPKGYKLDYVITDICNNVLYESEIGGFNSDVVLSEIYLDSILNNYAFTISGRLLDCDQNPIDTGFVEINFEHHFKKIWVETDGTFQEEISFNCTDFPEILAIGYNHKFNRRIETVIELGEDIDLGDMVACDAKEDYFRFTYDGQLYEIIPSKFKWGSSSSFEHRPKIILATSPASQCGLVIKNDTMFHNENIPAIFWNDNFEMNPEFPTLQTQDFDIQVTITDENDEFITGFFTGNVMEKDTTGTFPIQGSFKARK